MDDDMEKITIRLPASYLRRIDFLVKVEDFPSRSEVIRTAIRDLIYDRVDLVIEKTRKLHEAEQQLARMEEIEKQFFSR